MKLGDGWYESEEPTRVGLVFELRRIATRVRVRPLPPILLAAIVTMGIAYKFLNKPKVYEADVVLAITEGQQLSGKDAIPFDQLREYVTQVLMPDAKLAALIEDRNLHRLRHTFGMQYALQELRDQAEVTIWKNSFVYYDEEAQGRKSARVGITVADGNPDLAVLLARDLASIVMTTHDEERRKVARDLAAEVESMRKSLAKQLADLTTEMTVKQTALAAAQKAGNPGLAGALAMQVTALAQEEEAAAKQLSLIIRSPEAIADRFAAAGLGMRIELADERRPDRQEQSPVVAVMVLVVVAFGALLGSSLFLGAFDSRVHDTDDVARLGLPVLGHVPGFPGDDVGSLHSRGARRARVPWYLRWRSPR